MKKSTVETDRREYRRKRKKRNQVLAYMVLLFMVIAIGSGAVFGMRMFNERPMQEAQESSQEASQEMIEDMLASEETIEIPEETEEVPELTAEETLDIFIDEQIAQMRLDEKVAGLFFVTPEAITGVSTAVQAGEGTKTALEKYPVGGLIYFKKNIQSKEQITQMISNSQEYSKYPLFIGVDEEGGTVSRVAEAGLASKQPSAAQIGATNDANNAYVAGKEIGTYLAELGFNVNFAPVADLANVADSAMKDRAYGSEAAVVAPFVTAMMNGLQEQDVVACLKHFPGIGSTSSDTHTGLATITKAAEELLAEELQVFKSGIDAGAQMIMVGHVNVPALDEDNNPASMSKAVITDMLRNELGYDGVIIADALNMAAISEYYTSEQAVIMALKAGCDMVMMPEDFVQAYAGVMTAVSEGMISEQRINDSLKRIYRIKYAGTIE